MEIKHYWELFLKQQSLHPNTPYLESFAFGINEKQANALAQLVLDGKKTATTSSVLEYQGGAIPSVGDYSIVTLWDQTPVCVIQTTKVTLLPFRDMTYDICKREGEDDTLTSWITSHRSHFEWVAQQHHFEFTEDLMLVFEDFKVFTLN